jgi:hypothetical protein
MRVPQGPQPHDQQDEVREGIAKNGQFLTSTKGKKVSENAVAQEHENGSVDIRTSFNNTMVP